MAEALDAPEEDQADLVEDARDALLEDTEDLQLLMQNLTYLLIPPAGGVYTTEPTTELKLLGEVLDLAAHHKDLFRNTPAVPETLLTWPSWRGLGWEMQDHLESSSEHPYLVAAHEHLGEAALLGSSKQMKPSPNKD